jgi:hypothetical protein
MMAASKTRLTVFRSINGAIFINCLSPREKINSGYFCEKLLDPLSQILLSWARCRLPKTLSAF